eukprot:PhM_4_TR17433/c0_g1_i5/m.25328
MRDTALSMFVALKWDDAALQLDRSPGGSHIFSKGNTTIGVVYYPGDYRREMRKFFRRVQQLAAATPITDVFFSHGIWLVGKATPKDAYQGYYDRTKVIMNHLVFNTNNGKPQPRVTHLLTRTALNVTADVTDNWLMWLWTYCQTPERSLAHRVVQRCAVARAMKEMNATYTTIDFGRGLAVSSLARALILPDGHHHHKRGAVNHAMARVFLHRLCFDTDVDDHPVEEECNEVCVLDNDQCYCPALGVPVAWLKDHKSICHKLNPLKNFMLSLQPKLTKLLRENDITLMSKMTELRTDMGYLQSNITRMAGGGSETCFRIPPS